MHLLRVDTVSLDEGEAAVDLGQTPGDVVALSFTDADLAGLAFAQAEESRAAAMPSLIEMIERLWLKAGPILNLDMRHEPRRLEGGSAMQAHARLLEAVRRRDAPAARAALEDDIAAAAAHIEETGQLRA